MKTEKINIFWFRRDIRIEDNTGLFHALISNNKVIPLFIFDTEILNKIENKYDRRVQFIFEEIQKLKKEIEERGSSLLIKKGKPLDIFKQLIETYNIKTVFLNHDYEPQAIKRDNEIKKLLLLNQIEFKSYKDHVIFEKDEILKEDGKPYTIFTYYKNKWLKKISENTQSLVDNHVLMRNFLKIDAFENMTIKDLGFSSIDYKFPEKSLSPAIISNYTHTRDYPAYESSRIGIHLRFGTISIRKAVLFAQKHSQTWLNELIWREFFMQILFHFPYVENESFKKQYNKIEWENNESNFKLWCEGKTGYAIVDAGMRELNNTGFMHNRVRMITASFLCKHLLIDWRWGEAYFAKHLLDYELSSNNGNWQWAAGTGCDAAPYFRIFNPITQTQKFDNKLIYIKKWVNELKDINYKQMIDHNYARERCLTVYKKALQ